MQGTITARAHDDAPAVSLALDRALRKWDGLLELLPIGIYTCDADGAVVHYNRRAVELWGRTPPAGQSFCGALGTFAATGEALAPDALPMGEVLRAGKPARNRELVIERPDGTRIDILVDAEPIFGEDGRLVGGVNCFRDISDRKRAEGAFDAHERWHSDILEALPAAIYTTDAEGKITFFNRAAARLWGVSPKLGSDTWCGSWRLFWPDGRPMRHDECPMATALRTDRPVNGMSALAERPDGTRVPFVPYPTPLHDAAGKLVGAVNMLMDTTEQQRDAAALAGETGQLETLSRIGAQIVAELDLEKLVQAVTDAGVALTGAAFGAFFYNVQDAEGARYTLYTLSGVPREAFERFPMPRKTGIFAPTFDGTGILRSDDIQADSRYGQNAPHAGMPKGHLPVRSYLAVPVVSRSGEVLGGLFFGHPERGVFTERAERTMEAVAAQAAVAIDNARLFQSAQREIAERKQAEARLRVMLDELNHRVKNTLATVQSLAAHTFRGTKVPAALRQSFEGRLYALSRIHNQLARTHWETADLQAILRDVFAPFAREGHERVCLSGGAVKLAPDTALVLAIALHELATNAAKYGSLSCAEGRLEVSWTVSEGTDGDMLRITWTEHGGPPVRRPSRRGFGSQLLERGIGRQLKGEAEIVFDPDGVRYTMVLPIVAARNAADGSGRNVPREAA